MKILAIETSCDETAIAIADFLGPKTQPRIFVLSNIVSSQVKLHAKYGGVVPNLAKREHQRNLVPLLITALREAKLLKIFNFQFFRQRRIRLRRTIFKQIPKSKIQKIEKILEREPELLKRFKKYILQLKPPAIDALAVTYGPGLAPTLWVGVNFAKALAYLWNKPLIPVNHMAGHLYSAFLQKSGVENLQFFRRRRIRLWWTILNFKFPAVALLVSGGHTELVLMREHGKFKIIGETLDDAAGEAFDKVARILGLGYPGGPPISAAAEMEFKRFERLNILNGLDIHLPRPMINTKDYNFSFSGLKTAVLYLVRDLTKKYPLKQIRPLVAREFQNAIVEVLVKKTIRAAKEYRVKTILLGGGVSANKLLRQKLSDACEYELSNVKCKMPDVSLSVDNALMIAVTAYFIGKKKALDKVGADANLRL